MWQDMRKRSISCIFQTFSLKRLHLWNHSSYELETWQGYSSILLHSIGILSPAHFLGWWGEYIHWLCLKIAILWVTLVVHHLGREACCSLKRWICEVGPNCLQIKWEAWGSRGLGMVAAWKMPNNRVLREIVPFFYIHDPWYKSYRIVIHNRLVTRMLPCIAFTWKFRRFVFCYQSQT